MTALDGLEGIALVADDILTYGTGDTFEDAEANHDHRSFLLRKIQNTLMASAQKL